VRLPALVVVRQPARAALGALRRRCHPLGTHGRTLEAFAS
jgi:hypothetical protein